jgi:hypothetical protein
MTIKKSDDRIKPGHEIIFAALHEPRSRQLMWESLPSGERSPLLS